MTNNCAFRAPFRNVEGAVNISETNPRAPTSQPFRTHLQARMHVVSYVSVRRTGEAVRGQEKLAIGA